MVQTELQVKLDGSLGCSVTQTIKDPVYNADIKKTSGPQHICKEFT